MSPQPNAPTHPNDWTVGLDDYLKQNRVLYDEAIPLNTSTSCYLWRLEGMKDAEASANGYVEGQPVVMKCADSTPKSQAFQVSPDRLRFEVKALTCKAVKEACEQEPSVQVPRVLRTTTNGFIMNWLGQTDLWTAYRTGELLDVSKVGARLGRWLGCLHLAGIALGPDGWSFEHSELSMFYAPGGLADQTINAAMDKDEAEKVLAAMRIPAPIRTLTPWDFRPMNIVVHFTDDKNAAPGLAVVDWELCHYGDPCDDIRMWVAEVVILETKLEKHGLLSSFLSAYKHHMGAAIVDHDFVFRVALNVGIYILWLVPMDPAVWDCTEEDVESWKTKSLEFIRAGVNEDLAWIERSCLKYLLD
ncbi:uncharacterized protein CTRU02_215003 [Colletotrichum truncatum]|uniref:Uncharacterized protein n=1 Tax=Colletotrichum truncatum TaxID=5467 RepID=A0ACC3YE94_COLTU|nr:uncharacterized protein CTRU02_08245 [Colletotrichum truncatum]KAF6790116.1 hypothetical protein CTRU02_08245 [Colletotrichum truncatum]